MLEEEANKKKEEAKRLEEEAQRKKEEANQLAQEAKMQEENEKKIEKTIEDEIISEEKKEIKKFKAGIELSNLSDRLKLYGIEVNADIKGFINNDNYTK